MFIGLHSFTYFYGFLHIFFHSGPQVWCSMQWLHCKRQQQNMINYDKAIIASLMDLTDDHDCSCAFTYFYIFLRIFTNFYTLVVMCGVQCVGFDVGQQHNIIELFSLHWWTSLMIKYGFHFVMSACVHVKFFDVPNVLHFRGLCFHIFFGTLAIVWDRTLDQGSMMLWCQHHDCWIDDLMGTVPKSLRVYLCFAFSRIP